MHIFLSINETYIIMDFLYYSTELIEDICVLFEELIKNENQLEKVSIE